MQLHPKSGELKTKPVVGYRCPDWRFTNTSSTLNETLVDIKSEEMKDYMKKDNESLLSKIGELSEVTKCIPVTKNDVWYLTSNNFSENLTS